MRVDAGEPSGQPRAVSRGSSVMEDELRRRMPIGWQVNLSSLKREFVDGKGYSEQSLARALHIMAARETIRMRHGGSVVFRAGA